MPEDRFRLSCLDLFSGIGMFTYAMKEVFRTVAYCEKDATCRRVLEHNVYQGRLPSGTIYPDIQGLRGKDLKHLRPRAITAGFPCQDVSLANPYGLGLKGKRSGLVYDVFRLVDELSTIEVVLLENSPVILKRGIEILVEELRCRKFEVSYGVFSAEDCGAPQIRRRAFILAVRNGCILPVMSKRALVSRWLQEPCPRVIPRVSLQQHRLGVKRNCLAGNSVVPQTVAWAYMNLSLSIVGKLNVARGTRVPLHTILVFRPDKRVEYYQKHPGVRPRPRVRSLMRQGDIEIRKSFWMTPAASPLWYQYRILTDRSSFLLSNQLFYDVDTVKYMNLFKKPDRKDNGDQRRDKDFMISPDWVAWLMGHPMDWTRSVRHQESSAVQEDGCNTPAVLALTDSSLESPG